MPRPIRTLPFSTPHAGSPRPGYGLFVETRLCELLCTSEGEPRALAPVNATGFLFKAGDAQALAQAVEDLLARRDLWPRIRAQARRYVEVERTWKASVARYVDVYARALSGRAAPAVSVRA